MSTAAARPLLDRCLVAGQPLTIETSSEEVRATLRHLLRGFGPVDIAATEAATYGLHHDNGVWTVSSPANPPQQTPDPLTAYSLLEAAIVKDALARRDDLFQLHGGALCHPLEPCGVLVSGPSHHGKTTLALGLVLRGFLPFGDDTVLIEPSTLDIHPFPRAFHVSDHTWSLITALHGGVFTRPRTTPREYFSPPQWATRPVPVRWIVFTELGDRPAPSIRRLPPAEAAAALLRQTTSLDSRPQMALATISQLTARAECYRLVAGEPGPTIAAVLKLIAGQL